MPLALRPLPRKPAGRAKIVREILDPSKPCRHSCVMKGELRTLQEAILYFPIPATG
jgi:hypothetical protein